MPKTVSVYAPPTKNFFNWRLKLKKNIRLLSNAEMDNMLQRAALWDGQTPLPPRKIKIEALHKLFLAIGKRHSNRSILLGRGETNLEILILAGGREFGRHD